MRWKSHVRCGAGEKLEILSKTYLSLFDCTLWTGIAETTSSYCKKGDLLGIKGRVQTRVYEEEERKRYIYYVQKQFENYKPKPVRRIEITKSKSKTRT